MALIFTMVGFTTSYFLTTATKVSCYSSNVISLLCLLSLAPALSVISVDIKIKWKERIGFVVVVLPLNVRVAVRFIAETRGYFRYNMLLPPTGSLLTPSSLPQRPYGDVVTKFSGIGGFPFSLRYGAARSRKLRYEILFSRGEKTKVHIFAPPCNILHISNPLFRPLNFVHLV